MPTFTKLSVENLYEKVKPIHRATSKITSHQHHVFVLKYDADLMDLAYKLLTENGYDVIKITEENYEGNCYVDDQLYVNLNDDTFASPFSNHRDNKAIINHDVHTCIFYLENTFQSGGNLRIMSSIRVDSKCVESIDTRKYNVILLDGSIAHEIEDMEGIGQRRCIVVQIKQL